MNLNIGYFSLSDSQSSANEPCANECNEVDRDEQSENHSYDKNDANFEEEPVSTKINNAPFNDPAFWIIGQTDINKIISEDWENNLENLDFSTTKRIINGTARFMNKSIFTRKLHNGEYQNRSWLIYSQSTKSVFCGPCKLFGKQSEFNNGCNDWRNINQILQSHEKSKDHAASLVTFVTRRKTLLKSDLESQSLSEIHYWKKVLTRLITAIK